MPEYKTIACVNQKGGVGKSVTSTNLGVGLAQHGKQVLIVDCDSQASQTISLGWREDELHVTLATLFAAQLERRPLDPREAILHHGEGSGSTPSPWCKPMSLTEINLAQGVWNVAEHRIEF
jgi:chromosome partitioning protein